VNPAWFNNAKIVGITAGASAPEVLVEDVIDALRRLGPVEVSQLTGPPRNHRIPLAARIDRTADGVAAARRKSSDRRGSKYARKGYGLTVSLRQMAKVGSYIVKQRLAGRKRYPLVLMLEPLFRCNLACVGCGKIDYPDAILNKRLSVQECLDAVDECGAPMVAIPGGEPLIHKEIGEIVKGIVARKKFVSLCTNALLLEKKLHLFEPSPYLFFSVHLDGIKEHHDKSVCMDGGFDKAVDRDQGGQGQRLCGQRQLHGVRRPSGRGHRQIPRPHRGARRRRLDFARLCL
jgi:hypothetical protein